MLTAPSIAEYDRVLQSDLFHELELFSGRFLAENSHSLSGYSRKWVSDPLHQWSRQWEYPFVYNEIRSYVEARGRVNRVLDAGSGVTFFPYCITSTLNIANVECSDYDATLADLFRSIGSNDKGKVTYTCSDLRELKYDPESFDIVYCISVLEHTDDYEGIVDHFHRIIRPGGKLIVTFDLSLDGNGDIPVDKAGQLLTALGKRFAGVAGDECDLGWMLSKSDLLTTRSAALLDKRLIPWKQPSFLEYVKTFVKSGKIISWPPNYAVCGVCLTKEPC